MKNIKTYLLTILNLCILNFLATGQDIIKQDLPYEIPLSVKAVKGTYGIGVNFNKTTHLIFKGKIKYVDLGSDMIIASVPNEIENVLRVKSNVPANTFAQTNLTVITDDSNIYNFTVNYDDTLSLSTIDLNANAYIEKESSRSKNVQYTNPDLTESQLEMYSKEMLSSKADNIKHIGSISNKITFRVTDIQYINQYVFLRLYIKNKSNVNFDIDLIQAESTQLTTDEQQSIQTLQLNTVYEYDKRRIVLAEKNQNILEKIIVIPKQTLADNDILQVKLIEKGKRTNIIRITNKDLILATQK
jgi:conjugative transposon TraN protein